MKQTLLVVLSSLVLVACAAGQKGTLASRDAPYEPDPSGDPGRYIGQGNHPINLVCDVENPIFSNVGSWSCRTANAQDLARARRGQEEPGTRTVLGGQFAGAENQTHPLDLICDMDRVIGSNRTQWVCRMARPWNVDRWQRENTRDQLLDLQRRSTSNGRGEGGYGGNI